MKLYGRLLALAHEVGNSSADFKPTDQQVTVAKLLNSRLRIQSQGYQNMLSKELSNLNLLLKKANRTLRVKERKKVGGV